MLNDRTEVRNTKDEKKRWKAAADLLEDDVSGFMRTAANDLADKTLQDASQMPHNER